MEKLHAYLFYFHFTNDPTPKGRNGCYICYEVGRTLHHSPLLLDRGVFENQFYPKRRVHAELCFLNWFKESLEKTRRPGEIYRITWYMSWSPCVECAEQVAEFLNTRDYVRLRIVFSRLYYSRKPEYRQGLCKLAGARAKLAVMCPEDFEYCWDNFVDKCGRSFRYWKGIRRNYHALDETLSEILCNPMERLPPEIFIFNFHNLLLAPGRNSSYICFAVEEEQHGSPKSCYSGVFRNQPLHAEQRFLSWFRDTILSPRADYHVTWYMSWSPCFKCAEEVVQFLGEHKNVSLSICASRLYVYSHKDQQGLRHLSLAVAELTMMCPEDFEYCWDNFVDKRGRSFRYWKGIRRRYHALDGMLREILWG